MRHATTRRREIDRDRVREAVEAAERVTSGEIVVSIAPFFFGDVTNAAHHAFQRLGIGNTLARNGVLVFVVPARHQVVVLADDNAEARLGDTLWHHVAAEIAGGFARGNGTAGLVAGIERLGHALREAFPPGPDDRNELPDLDPRGRHV